MVQSQRVVEIEIVTPDGHLYEDRGVLIVVPGVEGELGIMAQHQPLVSLLAIGETRVRRAGGELERFATGIGYVEVLFDNVRVVVDHAEHVGEIDVARAQAARTRAEERLARRGDPAARAEVDFYRAEQALKRAENRIKVARRAAS
jgi:F-type H+-transporting ATPase subunit epsilon